MKAILSFATKEDADAVELAINDAGFTLIERHNVQFVVPTPALLRARPSVDAEAAVEQEVTP